MGPAISRSKAPATGPSARPRLRYQFQGTVTRLAIRAIPRSVHRLETAHLARWQRDCRVVLNRIIRQHQQVLLVTWKDLKGTLEYVTQETLVDAEGEDLPLDHTAATTLASAHTYVRCISSGS